MIHIYFSIGFIYNKLAYINIIDRFFAYKKMLNKVIFAVCNIYYIIVKTFIYTYIISLITKVFILGQKLWIFKANIIIV